MGVFDDALAAENRGGHPACGTDPRARLARICRYAARHERPAPESWRRLRERYEALLDPVPGRRRRADGEVVRWSICHLPAPDPDLGLVFLIEHNRGFAEWPQADRQARAAEAHPFGGPARLVRLELSVPEVARTSMRLLREFGLRFRPSLAGGGARDTTIGDQTLRLHPERGATVPPTIVIRAGTEGRSVDVLGCRWLMVPVESGA